MTFLSQTVTIPAWLLILMIAAMLPYLVILFKLIYRLKSGETVKEVHSDMVLWKVKTGKASASPSKSVDDFARDKRREKKADILQVLKIMAKEGEKGILIQSIADRMNSTLSKAQHAMKELVDKKLVDEIIGVSGTKYYLTQLGRNYCTSKGLL